MKKNIHPPYQEVLFVDSATNAKFVLGSTLCPEKREIFEGKEYPVCHVSISSASHPFFTGANQFVDTEGRIDKFQKRYKRDPQVAEIPVAPIVNTKKRGKKKLP